MKTELKKILSTDKAEEKLDITWGISIGVQRAYVKKIRGRLQPLTIPCRSISFFWTNPYRNLSAFSCRKASIVRGSLPSNRFTASVGFSGIATDMA